MELLPYKPERRAGFHNSDREAGVTMKGGVEGGLDSAARSPGLYGIIRPRLESAGLFRFWFEWRVGRRRTEGEVSARPELYHCLGDIVLVLGSMDGGMRGGGWAVTGQREAVPELR